MKQGNIFVGFVNVHGVSVGWLFSHALGWFLNVIRAD